MANTRRRGTNVDSERIEGSFVWVDLSGFTQVVYQAGVDDTIMDGVCLAARNLFALGAQAIGPLPDVSIINTTGDGFVALVQGRTPTNTAWQYAQSIRPRFAGTVRSTLGGLGFRFRLDLRVALHHGRVWRVPVAGVPGNAIYVGDDLNLLARVVDSQICRRAGIAATRAFFRRWSRSTSKDLVPDEILADRNKYPEPIEIFRVEPKTG